MHDMLRQQLQLAALKRIKPLPNYLLRDGFRKEPRSPIIATSFFHDRKGNRIDVNIRAPEQGQTIRKTGLREQARRLRQENLA
jgi:hypothetical protein